MIRKDHRDHMKEKSRSAGVLVVITLEIILSSMFVTTLSPQWSSAQNASGGFNMVNNQKTANKVSHL